MKLHGSTTALPAIPHGSFWQPWKLSALGAFAGILVILFPFSLSHCFWLFVFIRLIILPRFFWTNLLHKGECANYASVEVVQVKPVNTLNAIAFIALEVLGNCAYMHGWMSKWASLCHITPYRGMWGEGREEFRKPCPMIMGQEHHIWAYVDRGTEDCQRPHPAWAGARLELSWNLARLRYICSTFLPCIDMSGKSFRVNLCQAIGVTDAAGIAKIS